jgi:hypothetical protein
MSLVLTSVLFSTNCTFSSIRNDERHVCIGTLQLHGFHVKIQNKQLVSSSQNGCSISKGIPVFFLLGSIQPGLGHILCPTCPFHSSIDGTKFASKRARSYPAAYNKNITIHWLYQNCRCHAMCWR